MKNKFYLKMAAVFALGLVLCGVGAAVCFGELYNIEIKTEPYQTSLESKEYVLPKSNEVVYLQNTGYKQAKIIEDNSIAKGTFVIDVEYADNAEIEFNNISNDYYIKDIVDDEIKYWQVKCLEMPYVMYMGDSVDEWNEVREFVKNIKQRKIITKTYGQPEVSVKINPEDRGQFVSVWNHSDINVLSKSEYIEQIEEREQTEESEVTVSQESYDDDEYDVKYYTDDNGERRYYYYNEHGERCYYYYDRNGNPHNYINSSFNQQTEVVTEEQLLNPPRENAVMP